MTSKISFFKMVLNDSRRRLWLFILLSVGFLLTIPLVTAIFFGNQQIQLAAGTKGSWEVIDGFKHLLGINALFVSMGIVISATLGAFSGFRYLYKRTKLDVFHSIPIKREKLFLVQYISGMILFTIPFVISYLLMMLICAVNGFFTGEIFVMVMQTIGYGLLHFLAYYNIAILAIMLTGKIIVGILGMIVFWGYMPVLYAIIQGLYSRFFVTYYMDGFDERITTWLAYISPVSLQSIQVSSSISYYADDNLWRMDLMMVIEVAIIVLSLGTSIWLYRKRPSEAAEQAMAFPKTMPILKVLIMVVLSIGAGMFFELVAGSGIWFIFGMVLGLVLSQGLIAVIYTGDVRKIFTGKKSFGIATLIVITIVMIFKFDFFGYDAYIPHPDQVKSVGISINGLNEEVTTNSYEYLSDGGYRLQNGQVEDVPAIYELAKIGIEDTKNVSSVRNNINLASKGSEVEYNSVVICFKMNNGRKVYRSYRIDVAKLESVVPQIYEEPSFKEIEYQLLTTKNDNIGNVFIENIFTNEDKQNIPVATKQKLIDAYKDDLLELKFADIKNANVLGVISYEYISTTQLPEGVRHGTYAEYEPTYEDNPIIRYPIYSACHKTLDVLKELGYELDGKVNVDDVQRIVMERNEDIGDKYSNPVSIEITDKDYIEKLLESPIYSCQNSFYQNIDEQQELRIYFGETSDIRDRVVFMRKEDVPAFVDEKFQTEAREMYGE